MMQNLIHSLDALDSGSQDIGWMGVLISISAVALSMSLSYVFSLKLGTTLFVATFRSIIQLSTLAFVLGPIFQANNFVVVILYGLFMVTVASYETSSRNSLFYEGMLFDCFIAIFSATFMMIFFCFSLILNLSPFWDARYFIPLTGMLLGNSINCATVSLLTFLNAIKHSNTEILFKISKGGNLWESLSDELIKAARIGLSPIINQLSILGMISIPGMMTGQILGGTVPMVAARYQLMIMFLIVGNCALSTIILLFLASKRLYSVKHGLCVKLIRKRSDFSGIANFI